MAFTLVELLVVVSLIAALITLLMPSLRAARAASRSVVCLSQQHQLGIAFTSYLGDSHGLFPTRGHSGNVNSLASGSTPSLFWFGELDPYYADNRQLLLCPEADSLRTGAIAGHQIYGSARFQWGPAPNTWVDDYRGSYGFNSYLYRAAGSYGELVGSSLGRDINRFAGSIQSGRISLGKTPLFVDCAWVEIWPQLNDNALLPPNSIDDPYYGFCYNGSASPNFLSRAALNRHPSRNTNLVFLDQSAQSVDVAQLWNLTWFPGWTSTATSRP